MIIDDWTNVFKEILPAIKRGAYNAIDWAHSKYVKPGLEEANIEEELSNLEKERQLAKKRAELEAER